jgi:hypothetical protein
MVSIRSSRMTLQAIRDTLNAVAVIDSVVAGAIAGIVRVGLGFGTATSLALGVGVFVLTLAAFAIISSFRLPLMIGVPYLASSAHEPPGDSTRTAGRREEVRPSCSYGHCSSVGGGRRS